MSRPFRAAGLFALLLGFWLVLSGRFDPLLVAMGVASAALVTRLALPVLEAALGTGDDVLRAHPLRLLAYMAWLVTRIPPAAFVVARVILDPRRQPRPGVLRFTTTLPGPAARTLLATSITAVPGTITLDVDGDHFVVHAFSPDAADDLVTAALQNRIARVFGAGHQDRPVLSWDPVDDDRSERES